MKIELVDPSMISPYPGNARQNVETVKALKKAIRRYGFDQPIVVDQAGVIVKGHARYAAAVELGMPKIPVVVSRASAEVNHADRLADNLIHDLSEWEDEALRAEMRDVGEVMEDVLSEKAFEEYYPSISSSSAPGEAFHEVAQAEVERARREELATNSRKRMYVKMVCPDCGEVFFLEKAKVRMLT